MGFQTWRQWSCLQSNITNPWLGLLCFPSKACCKCRFVFCVSRCFFCPFWARKESKLMWLCFSCDQRVCPWKGHRFCPWVRSICFYAWFNCRRPLWLPDTVFGTCWLRFPSWGKYDSWPKVWCYWEIVHSRPRNHQRWRWSGTYHTGRSRRFSWWFIWTQLSFYYQHQLPYPAATPCTCDTHYRTQAPHWLQTLNWHNLLKRFYVYSQSTSISKMGKAVFGARRWCKSSSRSLCLLIASGVVFWRIVSLKLLAGDLLSYFGEGKAISLSHWCMPLVDGRLRQPKIRYLG